MLSDFDDWNPELEQLCAEAERCAGSHRQTAARTQAVSATAAAPPAVLHQSHLHPQRNTQQRQNQYSIAPSGARPTLPVANSTANTTQGHLVECTHQQPHALRKPVGNACQPAPQHLNQHTRPSTRYVHALGTTPPCSAQVADQQQGPSGAVPASSTWPSSSQCTLSAQRVRQLFTAPPGSRQPFRLYNRPVVQHVDPQGLQCQQQPQQGTVASAQTMQPPSALPGCHSVDAQRAAPPPSVLQPQPGQAPSAKAVTHAPASLPQPLLSADQAPVGSRSVFGGGHDAPGAHIGAAGCPPTHAADCHHTLRALQPPLQQQQAGLHPPYGPAQPRASMSGQLMSNTSHATHGVPQQWHQQPRQSQPWASGGSEHPQLEQGTDLRATGPAAISGRTQNQPPLQRDQPAPQGWPQPYQQAAATHVPGRAGCINHAGLFQPIHQHQRPFQDRAELQRNGMPPTQFLSSHCSGQQQVAQQHQAQPRMPAFNSGHAPASGQTSDAHKPQYHPQQGMTARHSGQGAASRQGMQQHDPQHSLHGMPSHTLVQGPVSGPHRQGQQPQQCQQQGLPSRDSGQGPVRGQSGQRLAPQQQHQGVAMRSSGQGPSSGQSGPAQGPQERLPQSAMPARGSGRGPASGQSVQGQEFQQHGMLGHPGQGAASGQSMQWHEPPPPQQQGMPVHSSGHAQSSGQSMQRHEPQQIQQGMPPRGSAQAAASGQSAQRHEPQQLQQGMPPRGSGQGPASGQSMQRQDPQQLQLQQAVPSRGSGQGPPSRQSGQQQEPQQQHGVPTRNSGQPGSSHQGPAPLVPVAFTLGPAGTLELRMPYYDIVRTAMTRLEKAEWCPLQKCWQVPLEMHDEVVRMLLGLRGVQVAISNLHHIPASVIQAASGSPDDSARYESLPKKLKEQLMDFQREGVRFALRRGGKVLVGDEMGLGKTVQAIAIMSLYREEWPCLIITPSSLREQWADALHQWLGITDEKIRIIYSGKDCELSLRGIHFLILSYNFVGKMKAQLTQLAFKVVVLDESHYIKDQKAQRTKDTIPLVQKARRAVLLTGTPALSRPIELYTQLTALVPKAKLRKADYGERYCGGHNPRDQYNKFQGASNHDELYRLLTGTVMVRRLKKDVLTQLPEKRRQQVFLRLEGKELAQLKAVKTQMDKAKAAAKAVYDSSDLGELDGVEEVQAAGGGAGSGRVDAMRLISEMYQKTAELKDKVVRDYVAELLDNDQKFLIFAHHECLLNSIETAVRSAKAKHIRIDGKVAPRIRQQLVDTFQQTADCKVAILSIMAAGTGLTLTAASIVVFAEMTWVPGNLVQAEDRAHRIGQGSRVNVYYLHVKGSIDDIIWESVQNKLEHVGQVLNGAQDRLEVASQHHKPENGQTSLSSFLRPTPPTGGPATEAEPQSGSVAGTSGVVAAAAATGHRDSSHPQAASGHARDLPLQERLNHRMDGKGAQSRSSCQQHGQAGGDKDQKAFAVQPGGPGGAKRPLGSTTPGGHKRQCNNSAADQGSGARQASLLAYYG